MRASLTLLLFLSAVTASAAAAADNSIPPGCQSNIRARTAYESGRRSGVAVVNRAWLNVNSCDELERFSDIVALNVESYVVTGTSDYVICRYTGMVDGVFEQLDNYWVSCSGQCCQEGETIGELAAEVYCQLSILLGGLAAPDEFIRRPVQTCGFDFQMCCDSQFIGTSLAYAGLDALGQVVQCQTYTENSFEPVWTESRNLQCAYEPPDPD